MKPFSSLLTALIGVLFSLLVTGANSWNLLPGPPPPPHVQPDASNLSQRNITCLGDHSDIAWLLAGEAYRGQSMQALCARAEFGGTLSRWQDGPNYAGSCSGGEVIFSFDDARFREKQYSNTKYLRGRLECRTRCFCNHGLEDPKEQPKLAPLSRSSFPGPTKNVHDTVHVIKVEKRGHGRMHEAIPVTGYPDPVTRLFGPYGQNDVGIAISNKIQCDGPLPSFPLPPPFRVADFANNQELCAVQLSGGSPHANAGAYCHPHSTILRSLSFADDMTPRLDWTWAGTPGSLIPSASIRFHCWKNCLCTRPVRKPNYVDPLVYTWDWLVSNKGIKDMMDFGKGNKFPMGSSTDSKGRPRTSVKGANKQQSQCASTGDDAGMCTAQRPWPEEILGPLPKSIEKLTEVPQPPATEMVQEQQCGNSCEGNKDCGEDCICRIPSEDDIKTFGLDPVVQSAAHCLGVASVFGRDEDTGPRLEQSQCLCNATYIAPACCRSRDGVI